MPKSDILSFKCRKDLCAKPNIIPKVESASRVVFRTSYARGKLALPVGMGQRILFLKGLFAELC